MNPEVEIIDNFLPSDLFYSIKSTILGSMFPWYLNHSIVSTSQEHPLYSNQFTHTFYMETIPKSGHYQTVLPLVNLIGMSAIVRIKANLIPVRPYNYREEMHVDYLDFDGMTSIFYLNTNNGKTLFEEGLEVQSIENRLVSFKANTLHTGTACTDAPYRCVLNFNYYKWSDSK